MASPLRLVAKIAIKGLLPSFDNINPIIRELRGMGISYRYQDMRRDVGSALDWKHNVDASSRFNALRPMAPDLMVRSWTMSGNQRYRVFGLMTLEDPTTQLQTTRLVSYYTNVNMPEYEEEQEFVDLLHKRGADYWKQVIAFKRMAVMWNPERGHLGLGELEEI
jgi:hypothetical protein